MRETDIFDILGPIMIGPAVRIPQEPCAWEMSRQRFTVHS